MPAKHKNITYKTTEAPNPFASGQDAAYAEILLHNQRETRWWRLVVGCGSLLLFFISFLFSVYAVRLQKVVPVLINVMPSGESQYLGEVRQSGALTVPEAAIVFQARKFISNLRTVSTDREVVYENITECYAMITASYEPVMTRYLRGASPFDLVGKSRRSVEIESVIRVTGSSYQIDWVETTADSFGSDKKKMRAIVTVKILAATDETIKKNPLGIYIDNCEMTGL
jgi:type IV secretion system protein VirB5